jgi:hypothetical protein
MMMMIIIIIIIIIKVRLSRISNGSRSIGRSIRSIIRGNDSGSGGKDKAIPE